MNSRCVMSYHSQPFISQQTCHIIANLSYHITHSVAQSIVLSYLIQPSLTARNPPDKINPHRHLKSANHQQSQADHSPIIASCIHESQLHKQSMTGKQNGKDSSRAEQKLKEIEGQFKRMPPRNPNHK